MSSTGKPSASIMLKLPLVEPDTEFQAHEQLRVVGAVVFATAMMLKVPGVKNKLDVGVQPITLLDPATAMVPVEDPGNPLHITEAEQVR